MSQNQGKQINKLGVGLKPKSKINQSPLITPQQSQPISLSSTPIKNIERKPNIQKAPQPRFKTPNNTSKILNTSNNHMTKSPRNMVNPNLTYKPFTKNNNDSNRGIPQKEDTDCSINQSNRYLQYIKSNDSSQQIERDQSHETPQTVKKLRFNKNEKLKQLELDRTSEIFQKILKTRFSQFFSILKDKYGAQTSQPPASNKVWKGKNIKTGVVEAKPMTSKLVEEDHELPEDLKLIEVDNKNPRNKNQLGIANTRNNGNHRRVTSEIVDLNSKNYGNSQTPRPSNNYNENPHQNNNSRLDTKSQRTETPRIRNNLLSSPTKTPENFKRVHTNTGISDKKVSICVRFKNEEIEKRFHELQEKAKISDMMESQLNMRSQQLDQLEIATTTRQEQLDHYIQNIEERALEYETKVSLFELKCTELDTKEKELMRKTIEFDKANSGLVRKEKELNKTDELLQKRSITIEQKIQEFKTKEQDLLKVNQEINTKNKELSGQEKAFQTQKNEHEKEQMENNKALEEKLKQLEQKSVKLEKSLNTNEDTFEKKSKLLKTKESEQKGVNNDLRASERELNKKTREIETRTKQLDQRKEEFNQTNSELKKAEESIKKLQARFHTEKIQYQVYYLKNRVVRPMIYPVYKSLLANKDYEQQTETKIKKFEDIALSPQTQNFESGFGDSFFEEAEKIIHADGTAEFNNSPIYNNVINQEAVFMKLSRSNEIKSYAQLFSILKQVDSQTYCKIVTIKYVMRVADITHRYLNNASMIRALEQLKKNAGQLTCVKEKESTQAQACYIMNNSIWKMKRLAYDHLFYLEPSFVKLGTFAPNTPRIEEFYENNILFDDNLQIDDFSNNLLENNLGNEDFVRNAVEIIDQTDRRHGNITFDHPTVLEKIEEGSGVQENDEELGGNNDEELEESKSKTTTQKSETESQSKIEEETEKEEDESPSETQEEDESESEGGSETQTETQTQTQTEITQSQSQYQSNTQSLSQSMLESEFQSRLESEIERRLDEKFDEKLEQALDDEILKSLNRCQEDKKGLIANIGAKIKEMLGCGRKEL